MPVCMSRRLIQYLRGQMFFRYRIEAVIEGSKAEITPTTTEGVVKVKWPYPIFSRRSTTKRVSGHFMRVAERKRRRLAKRYDYDAEVSAVIHILDRRLTPEDEGFVVETFPLVA